MSFGPWLGKGEADVWQSPVSPHVRGRYERRTPDNDPVHVQCVCDYCKKVCKCVGICHCPAEFHMVCTSGAPRQRIAMFAAVHLHRQW